MIQFNRAKNFLITVNNSNVQAAVFAAHPDDETIWMGGTILLNPDWNWKIFMATHTENDNRGNEFLKAIQGYSEKVKNLSYEFMNLMPDTQNPDEIDQNGVFTRLSQMDFDQFDVMFTHNIDGEYRHPNHEVLGSFFRGQKHNIWHFLCPAIKNPREKQIGQLIEAVQLDSNLLVQKKRVFENAYHPSQQYLWENFSDFMQFQFYSGTEMFTKYSS